MTERQAVPIIERALCIVIQQAVPIIEQAIRTSFLRAFPIIERAIERVFKKKHFFFLMNLIPLKPN
jgi:hypothetical protein